MHAVMDHLMIHRKNGLENVGTHILAHSLAREGRVFHDRKLTPGHVDDMILPALDALDTLESMYDGYFKVVDVERRVKFPGIPGAYGTCDLILENEKYVMLIDWKFGAGIGVRAVYTTDDGTEVLNPQLAFYAKAALATTPKIFTGRKIIVAIIQPRAEASLTHTVVSRNELKWFQQDLENAATAALDRDPKRRKGEHCRFAACKVNCPLWLGPLLDLSALGVVVENRTDAVSKTPTAYGDYLAKAKALVDIVSQFKGTLDEQLHAYLEDGGQVPGWRLKAKTKARQWVEDAAKQLDALGFREDEIFDFKLKSFKAADATAKRLGVTIPDHLRVAPVTNETTVCPTDDPAPVVERQLAIEQFQASLKMLEREATKSKMENAK